ncbi:hypothetical protein VTI74DRAFT_6171 [Chaetomium olivicolor]
MKRHIEAAKNQVTSIMEDIRAAFFHEADFRVAVVGYKDHDDAAHIQYLKFTHKTDKVYAFWTNLSPQAEMTYLRTFWAVCSRPCMRRTTYTFFQSYAALSPDCRLHESNKYWAAARALSDSSNMAGFQGWAVSSCRAHTGLQFDELNLGTSNQALRHMVVKIVITSASRSASVSTLGGGMRGPNRPERPALPMIHETPVESEEESNGVLHTTPPQWDTPGWLNEVVEFEAFSTDVHTCINTTDLTVHMRDQPFAQEATRVAAYARSAASRNRLVVKSFKRRAAQAFSHFTFERSRGRSLVSDMQSVGHVLADPAIHTLDPHRFPLVETNLHAEGFKFFFVTHECNSVCAQLGLKSNRSMILSGDYKFRNVCFDDMKTANMMVCCSNKLCSRIVRTARAKTSDEFSGYRWCNNCWPELRWSIVRTLCTAPGPLHEFKLCRFFYESQGQIAPRFCPKHRGDGTVDVSDDDHDSDSTFDGAPKSSTADSVPATPRWNACTLGASSFARVLQPPLHLPEARRTCPSLANANFLRAMGRKERIARSIARAIINTNGTKKPSSNPLGILFALFSTFFTLYQLFLRKIRPADFANLRRNHWDVTDDDYLRSFQPEGEPCEEALKAIGDMGFSGSTFYSTTDQKYLVKSVPRHSEHSFFSEDLLTPYVQYMATHPRSLLVRICDFLGASRWSIGRLLRFAPSHHIVMDNIMYGREEAKKRGEEAWEHWDLKPTSYFYPERDIAGGALTSETTKSQLADEFHDKIVLSRDQAEDFFASLEADTKLLAEHNAVDYSLFLVRMRPPRQTGAPPAPPAESSMIPTNPPSIPPPPPTWRTGVASADGKYIFRASILDFFWAKHKVQPRFMTLLIKAWNVLVSKDGHMSITTTPNEYQERFLKMCRGIVELAQVIRHRLSADSVRDTTAMERAARSSRSDGSSKASHGPGNRASGTYDEHNSVMYHQTTMAPVMNAQPPMVYGSPVTPGASMVNMSRVTNAPPMAYRRPPMPKDVRRQRLVALGRMVFSIPSSGAEASSPALIKHYQEIASAVLNDSGR